MIVRVSQAGLDWGAGLRRCALGRGGINVKRREGDGITPLGRFPLRQVFYRADKVRQPETSLPVSVIQPQHGWCDMPGDPSYNRPVHLPYPASAESLWRMDDVYDLIVVIGFNDDPVRDGAGSAIFLHLAKPDYSPTEGCVALHQDDMYALLKELKPGAQIEIS